MNRNWKEFNKEKNLFKTNYCSTCQQRKTCRKWENGECCACFLEKEKEIENYWEQEKKGNFVSYLNQKENGLLRNPQEPPNYYLFHGKFYPYKKFCELKENFQEKSRKWWQEIEQECQCESSKKVRINSDYLTSCQGCEKEISVASKKRVIKNRNDPRFWGLEIKEKVLCSSCLTNYQQLMPQRKKYLFNEYEKKGVFKEKFVNILPEDL